MITLAKPPRRTAMTKLIDRLPELRGEYREDAPLAPLTWFKVGGPAEILYRPADEADLMDFLAAKPGVERYETMSRESLFALLKPWIGEAGQAQDLPIPMLIDVTVDRDTVVDIDLLAKELQARVPGVSVDDHRVWLSQLVRLVTVIQVLAWCVLGLIALATMGTVVFTTRTGLAIHREAIEVLHLIGAQDAYIARQFAARALALGLKGGFLGLALAAPTLAGIGYLASETGATMIPKPDFGFFQVVGFVLLPVAVAFLAMITARATVMRNLKRMT